MPACSVNHWHCRSATVNSRAVRFSLRIEYVIARVPFFFLTNFTGSLRGVKIRATKLNRDFSWLSGSHRANPRHGKSRERGRILRDFDAEFHTDRERLKKRRKKEGKKGVTQRTDFHVITCSLPGPGSDRY